MITAEQARQKAKEQKFKIEQENLKITNLCSDAVERKIIKAIDDGSNSIKFRFNELGVLKINSLISEMLEKKTD